MKKTFSGKTFKENVSRHFLFAKRDAWCIFIKLLFRKHKAYITIEHQIYALNIWNYKVKLFAIRKYLWSLIVIQHHSLRVRHPSIPKCALQSGIWWTIVLDLWKWKEWISWWRWNLKKYENLCLCFYPTWFRPSGRWAKPKIFLQLFPISWECLVWMRKWLSHCMLLSWQARVSDWIYTP